MDKTTAQELEDLKVDMFPLHEKERSAAPAAFLLTLNEAKLLKKAQGVQFPIFNKYLFLDEEKIKTPEVQQQLRDEIIDSFKKNRISRDKLLKICEKVRDGRYWTYYITGIIIGTAEDSEKNFLYTVDSNVAGIGGKDMITPDTFPAFYSPNNTIADIAYILKLPNDVLYIPENELIAVRQLYKILDVKAAPVEDNEIDTQLVSISRITARHISKIGFPLDKLNSNIWRLTEDDTGNILSIGTEKRGKRKEVNVLYCIDFDAIADNVTITKKLEEYDRLVYIAIAALYNNGYKEMSPSMIYNTMGYTGRPSADDIAKINQSITKMSIAHIFVDNKEEVDNKYNYPCFLYDSSLLPMARIQLIVNGVLTDSAIKVFTEPPLMKFSRDRGQITTYNIKLLQAPVNKTEQNLRIQFYLLERIARAKSQHGERKILYSTVCDKADITAKKQRQRIPEKIKRYMDHFKECGEISGYTSDGESITFSF